MSSFEIPPGTTLDGLFCEFLPRVHKSLSGSSEGADRFVGGPGTDIATDYSRADGDTRVTIP